MPDARRTRSLVCAWGSEHAHEYSQRGRRDYPTFPTQWFTAYSALSPVTGLVCHRRQADRSANLTPASGRQDHTSLPSASVPFVCGTSASTASRTNVRDDRDTPLKWDGTGENTPVIWVGCEEEIFLQRGLDSEIADLPVGHSRTPTMRRNVREVPRF
jgi:hypothetical protein